MEEYDVRIDDNFLKADHVDGEVLSHTELNELENVTKTAINANYEDIQKIQDGTLSSGNADKLSDATLSTLAEETLQENDAKIPTSAQAKNYIDTQISAIDLSGYASTVYVDGEIDNVESEIPTQLSQLSDDSTHRLVTDTEKTTWNGKQNAITSSNKLSSDLVSDTGHTNKFVTDTEKTSWNAKYDKPSGGIPKTDLASAVQTSLGKADTAIQNSDLTDYVKNTDYATPSKGGVIKPGLMYGLSMDNDGYLRGYSVADYDGSSDRLIICKGTLEDVITDKGLVSNTDYATENDAGVVKGSSDLSGFCVLSNGGVTGRVYSYSDYLNKGINTFISKGTLENVLTSKNYASKTTYATNSTGGVIKVDNPLGIDVTSGGYLIGKPMSYSDYTSGNYGIIICKATLDNVIIGKGLVSNTDYATHNTAGVVRTNSTYQITTGTVGELMGVPKTYSEYTSIHPNSFICKGTLENVLNEKIGNIETLLSEV